MARRVRGVKSKAFPTVAHVSDGENPCIELTDFGSWTVGAAALEIGLDKSKLDSARPAIITTFIELNAPLLEQFGVTAAPVFSELGEPRIRFDTSDYIGATPLVSPTTGNFDLELIIKPRVGWKGLGPMLNTMGMKIVPELLRVAPLPRSDREIPSWVIASVVISRLESLLNDMSRKYELRHEVLQSPRGRIHWAEYAAKLCPQMRFAELPCEFTVLEEDRRLMGIIHFTLRMLRNDLTAQLGNGDVVWMLISRIEKLLRRVGVYPAVSPTAHVLHKWLYTGVQPLALDPALESIRWIAESRGLAGLADLNGLPWKMSMSAFFEAYVETVVKAAARYSGGEVLTGRLHETEMSILWDGRIGASQKSLIPDVVIKRGSQTVVVDAKFKRFKQQMSVQEWCDFPEVMRDEHREDLLQVLAYTTCFSEMPLSACLVYPVENDLYEDLKGRKLLHQHASLYENGRDIDVMLTAIPMRGNIDELAKEFAESLIELRDDG